MLINLQNSNFFMNLNNVCPKEHDYLENNQNNRFNSEISVIEKNLIHKEKFVHENSVDNIPNPDSDLEQIEEIKPKSFNNNLNLSLNEQEYQTPSNESDFKQNKCSENLMRNQKEKNNTNMTQLSTKACMQSDIEEGELLDLSDKSKSIISDENHNANTANNEQTGNRSDSISNSNDIESVYNQKNINNISNLDSNLNINSDLIGKNSNCNFDNSNSDKSRESIEKLNHTFYNSNNNSKMLSNNLNLSVNSNSNNNVNSFNGNNNRNNNIQKNGYSNNNYNNNKKANNSFSNLGYNKNNLKIQNNIAYNQNNQTMINNPQKNNNNVSNFRNNITNNNEQQLMCNNYNQYIQYMQNYTNLNNPNTINQIPNINNANLNNYTSSFYPQNPNFNNNLNQNFISQPINNLNNPTINAFTQNNNTNQSNFQSIRNNQSNLINNLNNPNTSNFNQAEKKQESTYDQCDIEIREFKLFYNNQPLNIQLSGKIKKENKLNSFVVYKMVTHDTFIQVFNSRLNFLKFNQLIVNMTFQIDKNITHAPTRKFLLELTEKNYFGLIKLEKSYYIIFSSLNKTMHNSLGSNIFSVFILNDFQKIQQLEKVSESSNNFSTETEKKNECQADKDLKELSATNNSKYEKEKLEKSIEELKRKLANERHNALETKQEFQKYAKRAKAELESDKNRINELISRLKSAESKIRDLEARLRAANEKSKSMELENIFLKNRTANNDASNNINKIKSASFNNVNNINIKNNSNHNKENFNSINIKRNSSSNNNNNTNLNMNSIRSLNKKSKYNVKALSKLADIDNKQIITDNDKVKINIANNLNEIELELTDIDEAGSNSEKKEIFDKIIDKLNYSKEELNTDSFYSNSISHPNIQTINSSNHFNGNNTSGNFISEIGFTARNESEENLLDKINELKEKLDAHCCVICYENNRDCLFEECGHLTCCYDCISNEMKRTDYKNYQRALKLNNKVNTFKFKFDFKCPVCQQRNKNFMKIIVS